MPFVKAASEEILSSIGLTMSQAVELFLRRVMVDQRIPFELVALQSFQIGGFSGDRDPLTGEKEIRSTLRRPDEFSGPKKGERPKKEFKKFFGGRTPAEIRAKRASKKGRI